MPDVQLLSEETWQRAAPQGLEQGQPELVVEVVSPSSRAYDRINKLAWYTSIGASEYWIVDPEARSLELLVLREGHYFIDQAESGDALFVP